MAHCPVNYYYYYYDYYYYYYHYYYYHVTKASTVEAHTSKLI